MPLSNYERLIRLAEDIFSVKNDPHQLDVDEAVLQRLRQLHPATVSEYIDGNGPVAWVLVFPTTLELMHRFLDHKISEKELFELTPLHETYEAIYLCSALVLEEYRRKGISKRLTLEAISQIGNDHPIKALFVWPFTPEGDWASAEIGNRTGLPLYRYSE